MVKIIFYMVLFVNVCIIEARAAENSVGHGPKARLNDHKREIKRKVPMLINKVITQPIIVEGRGGATVISGITAINMGLIRGAKFASLVEVRCPRRGHRVIIRGSRFINNGKIFTYRGRNNSSASILLYTCHRRGNAKLRINDSTFLNNGYILAR